MGERVRIFFILGIFILSSLATHTHPSKPIQNKNLFLNGFQVPFYSAPTIHSTQYRFLSYGESIQFDKEYLHEPTKEWIPIVDSSGLGGYIHRKFVLEYNPKKKFSTISKDILQKLEDLKESPNPQGFYELIHYLQRILQDAEFQGHHFLFFQIQFYKALGILSEKFPVEDWDPIFFSEYRKYMESNPQGKFQFNPEYLWELAYQNQINSIGEQAARSAVEFSAKRDCGYDPGCFLDTMNSSYLKYLVLYPNQPASKVFSREVVSKFQEFLKDTTTIACFQPVDPGLYRSFQIARYRSNFLTPPYRKKFQDQLIQFEKECF